MASLKTLGHSPKARLVMTMIEGGDAALDRAYEALKKGKTGAFSKRNIHLLAPVPVPIQLRDCLCFETHLKQAFDAGRRVRANATPDPEAAMKEFERAGFIRIPQTFYEQPIYYKANRFSVIGTEQDVLWPSYSKLMDFELEFGFYVRKEGVDIARDKARQQSRRYAVQSGGG